MKYCHDCLHYDVCKQIREEITTDSTLACGCFESKSQTTDGTTYDFDAVVNAQLDRCKSILLNKAKEYAQDADRLHNFHAAAGMMGCGTKEALAGMMAKHTISVYDMCRSGEKYPVELWDEKITDHINYLLLLGAAVEEEGG